MSRNMMTPVAMRAMLLTHPGRDLELKEVPKPEPGPSQVRLEVTACAVCRTDLHIFDGELDAPKLPLILGHEIVGRVDAVSSNVDSLAIGSRIGVPWLGRTCQSCSYCQSGRENLCDTPGFTGYTIDGGFAEYAVADARYCFPIAPDLDDTHTAPLLCAGLIGYRALRLAGEAEHLGLYGFGAAAHIVAQIAIHQGREVYAFTRAGDSSSQRFARSLGATWAGDSTSSPPQLLDAAIIFAPVGSLVPAALAATRKGGHVVCAGIHMSDIPSFPYALLWEERRLSSVANLTRQDGIDLLAVAEQTKVQTQVVRFALEEANEALAALRAGNIDGAAVLVP